MKITIHIDEQMCKRMIGLKKKFRQHYKFSPTVIHLPIPPIEFMGMQVQFSFEKKYLRAAGMNKEDMYSSMREDFSILAPLKPTPPKMRLTKKIH